MQVFRLSRDDDVSIEDIVNGFKTVEAQLITSKINKLHVNSIIAFVKGSDFAICKVTKLKSYETLNNLIGEEGFNNIVPKCKDVNSCVDYCIKKCCFEEDVPYGWIAIGLECVDHQIN